MLEIKMRTKKAVILVVAVIIMTTNAFSGQKSLFKSFKEAQWKLLGNANWSMNLANDDVRASKGKGYLVTKKSYEDFELKLEFYAATNSNSGVFFRCMNSTDINDKNCYEANIFDTRTDQSGRTGSITNIAAPQVIINSEGKWNTYEISAVGDRLTIKLNGVITVDINDNRHEAGPIALQFMQGKIKFKNVKIKTIKKSKPQNIEIYKDFR
jgi:hypothetical protein